MTTSPAARAAAPRPCLRDLRAALAELDTRLVDTLAGFDKVIEKAEPGFRPVAAEFRALHIRQRAAVATVLDSLGHDPDADGSAFGTVNRAVVTLRSWFDSIDHSIMDALVQGEKHVLEAYDNAIACAPDAAHRRMLTDDRRALVDLLDRHAGRGG